jgi:hypothetical protein
VNVGGKNLNLYAENYISIRHPSSNNTYYQFRCGINNLHLTNHLTPGKTIMIRYCFNISIHTLIQHDTVADKDVNVPEYLEIDTPNPMTDDVSKSIIIPYGLNVGLNDTQFTIYNVNENKNNCHSQRPSYG